MMITDTLLRWDVERMKVDALRDKPDYHEISTINSEINSLGHSLRAMQIEIDNLNRDKDNLQNEINDIKLQIEENNATV